MHVCTGLRTFESDGERHEKSAEAETPASVSKM